MGGAFPSVSVGGQPGRVVRSGRQPFDLQGIGPDPPARVAVGREPLVRGELAVAAQGGADGQEVARRRHVVDPQEVRPGVDPVRERGERAGPALARPAAGERADEVLARDGQQHRPAERQDRVEAPQHRDRLGGRLGEVRPRVEHDLLLPHPGGDRGRHPLLEEADDVGDHVVVAAGVEQRALRRHARVHDHERRARVGAHARQVRVAQAGDVVDDRRPGGHRGRRHRAACGCRPTPARRRRPARRRPARRARSPPPPPRRAGGRSRTRRRRPRCPPPSASSMRPRASRAVSSGSSPSSEKESGVALTMPISNGRPSGSTRPAARRTGGVTECAAPCS